MCYDNTEIYIELYLQYYQVKEWLDTWPVKSTSKEMGSIFSSRSKVDKPIYLTYLICFLCRIIWLAAIYYLHFVWFFPCCCPWSYQNSFWVATHQLRITDKDCLNLAAENVLKYSKQWYHQSAKGYICSFISGQRNETLARLANQYIRLVFKTSFWVGDAELVGLIIPSEGLAHKRCKMVIWEF